MGLVTIVIIIIGVSATILCLSRVCRIYHQDGVMPQDGHINYTS